MKIDYDYIGKFFVTNSQKYLQTLNHTNNILGNGWYDDSCGNMEKRKLDDHKITEKCENDNKISYK